MEGEKDRRRDDAAGGGEEEGHKETGDRGSNVKDEGMEEEFFSSSLFCSANDTKCV